MQGLRPHCPTPWQWEILERLAVKYKMDFPIESNEEETKKQTALPVQECAAR